MRMSGLCKVEMSGFMGARRSGGAPWSSWAAVESQVGGTLRATSCGPHPPTLCGLWADLGRGTFSARGPGGEPRDPAKVDGPSSFVAATDETCKGCACVARAEG